MSSSAIANPFVVLINALYFFCAVSLLYSTAFFSSAAADHGYGFVSQANGIANVVAFCRVKLRGRR